MGGGRPHARRLMGAAPVTEDKVAAFCGVLIVTHLQRSIGFKRWHPCCLKNSTVLDTLLIRWGRLGDSRG
jgi:hypothetical protein